MPHPASAIRGFWSAPALRGGGDHLLRAAAKTLYHTEAQALTLARLQGLRALHDAFPDADILARREACTVQEDTLHYNAVYTVAADICT